jgi:hypothetical protein
MWDSLFGHLRQPVAQILLTRNDIADVSTCHTPFSVAPMFLIRVGRKHNTKMLRIPFTSS